MAGGGSKKKSETSCSWVRKGFLEDVMSVVLVLGRLEGFHQLGRMKGILGKGGCVRKELRAWNNMACYDNPAVLHGGLLENRDRQEPQSILELDSSSISTIFQLCDLVQVT